MQQALIVRIVDWAKQPVEHIAEIPLEDLQFFLGDRHLFGPVVEDRQCFNIDDAKRRPAALPAVWRGLVGVVEQIVGECFRDRVSRSPFTGAVAPRSKRPEELYNAEI
ncbi:MAG: hypothetical protein Q4G24_13940 [Paracoccus sp. (in: a-proteobacteria)]|uniref:hypothetical protein n=1 Tax=Paracoccus sp. TaxID=267 RepID=UPI0026E04947|nr:hypothetical protein [Paracoccus sp. (in: a-proteobacteria)]MDO5622559.1 hypothetical protein [Paracoccus sp. (in: a-proteobacteria)]